MNSYKYKWVQHCIDDADEAMDAFFEDHAHEHFAYFEHISDGGNHCQIRVVHNDHIYDLISRSYGENQVVDIIKIGG